MTQAFSSFSNAVQLSEGGRLRCHLEENVHFISIQKRSASEVESDIAIWLVSKQIRPFHPLP